MGLTVEASAEIGTALEIPWKRSLTKAGPVEISYTDRSGKTSQRTIVAQSVFGFQRGSIAYPESITAFCTKANAQRTFKVDNIQDVVDQGTGEVMSAEAWLKLHIQK